jgi:hypothetical protein
MTRNNGSSGTARREWVSPALVFRGVVGDVLQSGGGKLSITAADPGENRCEKPHAADCNAASAQTQ